MESDSQAEQKHSWVSKVTGGIRKAVIAPLVILTSVMPSLSEAQQPNNKIPPQKTPAEIKKDEAAAKDLSAAIKARLEEINKLSADQAKKPDLSHLPKLIEDLENDDFDIRANAQKKISEELGYAALPKLAEALKKEKSVKAEERNFERIGRIERIFDTPVAPLRQLLAEAVDLGVGAPEVVPLLAGPIKAMLDNPPKWITDQPDHGSDITLKVVNALKAMEAPQYAVPALIQRLKSGDPDQIWDAANAVILLGPQMKEVGAKETGELVSALQLVLNNPEAPRKTIYEMAVHMDVLYDTRVKAVEALGAMGEKAKDARPYLIKLQKDKSQSLEMQTAAGEAVEAINSETQEVDNKKSPAR